MIMVTVQVADLSHESGNPADERVILFSAISTSDNLQLGIRLGLGPVSLLIAGLTSTFRTPATCISQWQNNITRSSAGLPRKLQVKSSHEVVT